ncbi:unnamed protein product [Dovyalis caffra]|uniref:Uncharacterized protein n=1 Tax=Dovyalis caffra TaxID=77055 RepID=A0AAV1S5V6_9ROSI|nr:unnamed protein product [Dovyalis caffra]
MLHLPFSTPRLNEANNFDIFKTLVHLRTSLSVTLDLLYPFSGRLRHNFYIDRFDEGVPFVEAQVNCAMSEFFEHPENESLSKLLPCCPFSKEPGDEASLISFHVNLYSCGRMVTGGCISHQFHFPGMWAAITRGAQNNRVHPDFARASSIFPSIDP